MLETIREYATERLLESGEAAMTRERHLDIFVAFAERAYEGRLASGSAWSPVVDTEHDNIRAALDRARMSRPDAEAQLAGGVAYCWLLRGYAPEAGERLAGALARYESRDHIRARTLTHLGDAVGDIGLAREALT